MTVWFNHFTIPNRSRVLRFVGLILLSVVLITTLFLNIPVSNALSTNKTINFQGRLRTSTGAIVEDGYYNIQFKIYEGGSGDQAGNPDGSLKWTETYINNGGTSGVEVRNGFLSVNLGSKTTFGSSVDWSKDVLWLSMNVAGSSANCTTFGSVDCPADGEMLPMNRLTATPYAINAGALGGKTAENFLQLAQGVQTDASTNTSSIAINKTGTGNLIQLQNTGADVFTVAANGNITLGNNADKNISVSKASDNTVGNQLSVAAGAGGAGTGSAGGSLKLQGGDGGGTNSNGGNVVLTGGAGTGTGTDGLVVISTPTYKTVTDDANCHTDGANVTDNCAVSYSSLNTASAVIIGFSETGKTATLGDPANLTPGRAYHILASGDSEEFKLSINGGIGTNLINVRPNTVVSLLWNGEDWTVSGTSNSSNFRDVYDVVNGNNNVQVGNGQDDGAPTLITLDRASTAPTGDDSLLGSMYYDTTVGAIQCYEADGWGDCAAKPDFFVSLTPEYAGSVSNGSSLGELSSDICSGTLGLNDGSGGQPVVCAASETYNFYDWTSSEATPQTKSIYVTYTLGNNFNGFVAGTTSLKGRTDSDSANVSYQIYKSTSGGLTACGSAIGVSNGAKSAWQTAYAADTNDPAGCGFSAGDNIVIKISLTASSDAHAYAGNLGFAFKTK